jgi:predicted PurR-regulated permease PerM
MAERRGRSTKPSPSETAPEHLHLWQIQAVRDLLVVAFIVLLVWAGYAMRSVTVPLLVALLLAYLFEPLIARLSERERVSRPMVVGGLLLAVGALVIATVAIVVPLLISQTMQLLDDFREGRFARSVLTIREYVPADYREEFDRVMRFFAPGEIELALEQRGGDLEEAQDWELPEENTPESDGAAPPTDSAEAGQSPEIPPAVAAEIDALRNEIESLRNEMTDRPTEASEGSPAPTSLLAFARRGLDLVITVIGEIIAIGLLAFLIPFYFFFFSVWYPSVVRFGRDLIPAHRRKRVLDLLQKMDRAVAGFVRGRIVISLIMGVMLAVGWQIVGVQYAIVLGFIIGFFSIVPYLGGVGIPLAIGLLWLGQVGEPESQRMAWYMIIIWPSLVFGIVQVVETYFLTPMIAGKATNLDPVSILVAVIAGGAIMGVYGMLLAIPFAACLKIIFMEVLLPRIKAWAHGQAEDPLPIKRD